jgi:hypothetical protein
MLDVPHLLYGLTVGSCASIAHAPIPHAYIYTQRCVTCMHARYEYEATRSDVVAAGPGPAARAHAVQLLPACASVSCMINGCPWFWRHLNELACMHGARGE